VAPASEGHPEFEAPIVAPVLSPVPSFLPTTVASSSRSGRSLNPCALVRAKVATFRFASTRHTRHRSRRSPVASHSTSTAARPQHLFQSCVASQLTRPCQPTISNPSSRERPFVTAGRSLNHPDTAFHPEGAIADHSCPSSRIVREAPRHLTCRCSRLSLARQRGLRPRRARASG